MTTKPSFQFPPPSPVDLFWRWLICSRGGVGALDDAPTSKLRLVLGVGRSGTTWLSGVLAQATPPMRVFYEPLYHMRPKLWLRFRGNPVSARPSPQLRFYDAFRLLCVKDAKWEKVFSRKKFPARNDPGFEVCLVKEVHALPAMESLVRAYNAPAIVLLRDPLYTLDSIFDAHGVPSPYLRFEERLFREPGFIERHLPAKAAVVGELYSEFATKDRRLGCILEKAMAIELVESLLREMAGRLPSLAKIMHYEELCSDTMTQFAVAAQFLGLPWDRALEEKAAATTRANETSGHRHSIFRDSAAQVKRDWRFLSESEAAQSRKVVERIRSA